MSDKKLVLDTDNLDIESERFIEVPIKGPGDANRLVVLNGIALSGTEDDTTTLDSNAGVPQHWNVLIHTKYRLADADRWQNIVDRNADLLQATWVSLCAIKADEAGGTASWGFLLALDSVTASIDSTNRVRLQIRAGLQGDSTIMKIAYQVNFLIKKAL